MASASGISSPYGSDAFGVVGVAGSMFALLLNDATKDEGEEYLDYCYPPEGAELQAIVAMKGVLLASCKVIQSAVGQEAAFLVFRSADNSQSHYKACFMQIEHWFLCMVFPGAASDGAARWFTEEAAALISLRHGRLSSLQEHFRQLDRIFRALGAVWRGVCNAVEDTEALGGHVYLSLRKIPWSPFADLWHERVGTSFAQWESRWELSTGGSAGHYGPLARPEGFALLHDQMLVATSLANNAFNACLRLCLLEGAFEAGAGAGAGVGGFGTPGFGIADEADVRCHSIFLTSEELECRSSQLLPSHQYSIIQRGPWLLFMLWRMSNSTTPQGLGAASAAAIARGGTSAAGPATADPFGVDLCIELLDGLPQPSSNASQASQQSHRIEAGSTQTSSAPLARGGGSSSSAASPAGTGGAHGNTDTLPLMLHAGDRKGRRHTFSLPCPLWKPMTRRGSKSMKRLSDHTASPAALAQRSPQRIPRGIFLQALALHSDMKSSQSDNSIAFRVVRKPSGVACDQLGNEDLWRIRCPELAARVAARRCQKWSRGDVADMLVEWSELESLFQEHERRRRSWSNAPNLPTCKHALVDVLKGGGALEKLWADCFQDLRGGTAGGGGRERQSLGSTGGEPWRFQAGAPYFMSDIAPITSIGMRTGAGQYRSWSAISGLRAGRPDEAPRRVFLQLDAMGEAA